MVVIARQGSYVHQAFDVDVGQLNEQTKTGNRRDHARERLAHAVFHELALEPVDHVTRSFVGTAFAHGTLFAQLLQNRLIVWIDARFRDGHGTRTANVRGVLLGMDHAADSPVREQIRVATNRRSEVRIRLVIQAKVTLVIRAVHRLTQRTQHHGLDQMEIRTVLDACQQRLVILRRRTVFALVQRQTQLAEEGPEFFQTLWRRTIVHTVQGWNFVLFQEFSRGHVGRQHAFLDQLVRIVARGRPDFGDFALSTEDDPGFLSFKINRATGMTSAQQHFVQRIKLLQVRHDASVFATQFLGFSRFWLLQDRADLVVGQAGMGVNDCLVELVISHLAGFGQGHFTDHGQAIDVRIQRAQAVGQLLGQHRNHALGEVHRVATHLRFSVQRRTDFDVARYVGDGDV